MNQSRKAENLLHALCVDGSYEDLSRVLRHSKIDINTTNINGLSAMHLCVFRSDNILKAMKLLHDNGADLNAKTLYEGDTVLHLLVRNINLTKAEVTIVELLHMGADPSISNRSSRSAADEAMMRNYRYLNDLLSNRISLETAREEHKKYFYEHFGGLLIEAIRKGDEKEIATLVTKTNINYRNKNGSAPIHYVITHCPQKNKESVLRLLIDASADTNVANYEGDSALNLLIKQNALRADDQMLRLAELLVGSGADPEIKDLDGNDAVKLSTDKDYQDILSLIRNVLDTKMANLNALFRAFAELEFADIKAELAKPGTNTNAYNQNGYAPIHVITRRRTAAKELIEEAIDCLLSQKANIDAQCQNDGNSALHLAVEKRDMNTAKFLVEKGIDQGLKNKTGETAFEMAMRDFNKQELQAAIVAKTGEKAKSKGACSVS